MKLIRYGQPGAERPGLVDAQGTLRERKLGQLREGDLRAWLKERLASYKVPRRILLFRDDEVSLTGSGAKVKAGEMRDKAIARLAAGKDTV